MRDRELSACRSAFMEYVRQAGTFPERLTIEVDENSYAEPISWPPSAIVEPQMLRTVTQVYAVNLPMINTSNVLYTADPMTIGQSMRESKKNFMMEISSAIIEDVDFQRIR